MPLGAAITIPFNWSTVVYGAGPKDKYPSRGYDLPRKIGRNETRYVDLGFNVFFCSCGSLLPSGRKERIASWIFGSFVVLRQRDDTGAFLH